jgi:hypothetical protein
MAELSPHAPHADGPPGRPLVVAVQQQAIVDHL